MTLMRPLTRGPDGVYPKRLLVVGVVIVVLPVAYGWLIQDAYALMDPLDHFTLMLSDIVPLTFPLLVSLLGAMYFAEVLSHRYLLYTGTRISRARYLAGHSLVLMGIAFGVFFAAVLLAWVVAFVVEPRWGAMPYYPAPAGGGTTADQRYTFSQLLEYSPLVYGLVYAVWVGVCASAYALLGMLLLLVVPHRFLALALPFLGYQVISFVLALAGLERYLPSSAIFPFNITQQPLWTPLVPLGVVLVLCAGLIGWIRTHRHEIQGLG